MASNRIAETPEVAIVSNVALRNLFGVVISTKFTIEHMKTEAHSNTRNSKKLVARWNNVAGLHAV